MEFSGAIKLHKTILDSPSFILYGIEVSTPYSKTIVPRHEKDFSAFQKQLGCFASCQIDSNKLADFLPRFPLLSPFKNQFQCIDQRKTELNIYMKKVISLLQIPIFNKYDPWIKLILRFFDLDSIQTTEKLAAIKIQKNYRAFKQWTQEKYLNTQKLMNQGWVVKLEWFPDDLIIQILEFLPINSLIRTSLVNKKFNQLSKQPILWKSLSLFGMQKELSVQSFSQICTRSWLLACIDLSYCPSVNSQILYVISQNCNPKALKKLYLDGCLNLDDNAIKNLTSQFEKELPESLLQLKNKRKNSFYRQDGLSEDLKGGARGLQHLSLAECRNLTEKGVSHLQKLKRLNSLNLLGCISVNDQSVNMIALSASNIKELNLSGTQISKKALIVLRDNCMKLKSLTLNSCRNLSVDDGMIFSRLEVEINEDIFRFQLFPVSNSNLPSIFDNILRTRSSLSIQRVAQFTQAKLGVQQAKIDILYENKVLSEYLTLFDIFGSNQTGNIPVLYYQSRQETKDYQMQKKRYKWNLDPPLWVPDQEVKSCMLCGLQFNIMLRKHHCRNCGKIVCNSCSKQRKLIPKLGFNWKKVRVCDFCADVIR